MLAFTLGFLILPGNPWLFPTDGWLPTSGWVRPPYTRYYPLDSSLAWWVHLDECSTVAKAGCERGGSCFWECFHPRAQLSEQLDLLSWSRTGGNRIRRLAAWVSCLGQGSCQHSPLGARESHFLLVPELKQAMAGCQYVIVLIPNPWKYPCLVSLLLNNRCHRLALHRTYSLSLRIHCGIPLF